MISDELNIKHSEIIIPSPVFFYKCTLLCFFGHVRRGIVSGMDAFPITTLYPKEFPGNLSVIPDAPKTLFLRGTIPNVRHFVTVVGSRTCSQYGIYACHRIIEGLYGYPIAVVSGLAYGTDTEAHIACLKYDVPTIAVPGSGVMDEVIYPAGNRWLAEKVLLSGGALLSEYAPDTRAAKWTFPKRNRIMAGMADVVLIIEATMQSGTLITARLGMEYNREVGAVPGDVTSPGSAGTHHLIRDGAALIRDSNDVLELLGIYKDTPSNDKKEIAHLTDDEQALMALLAHPCARHELQTQLSWPAERLSQTVTLLELKGHIVESLGHVRRI